MVKIKSVQPRQLLALALSLTAHLLLGYLLGIHAGGTRSGADKATGTLSVRLIVGANNPASKLAGVGKGQQAEKATVQTLPPAPVRTAVMAANEDSSIFTTLAEPEPYYFRAGELTEEPHVLLDISPDLSLSLPNGLSQLAVLRLLINELGDIDQVVMEDSTLSEEAQKIVIDAFQNTKFHPGKIDDMPVKSQLRIEVMPADMILSH